MGHFIIAGTHGDQFPKGIGVIGFVKQRVNMGHFFGGGVQHSTIPLPEVFIAMGNETVHFSSFHSSILPVFRIYDKYSTVSYPCLYQAIVSRETLLLPLLSKCFT